MDPAVPRIAPTVPLASSRSSSSQGVPARLGPYTIQGVLGQGGMGAVYAAWDPRLGRRVAVKVVLADVADESAERRLRAEAQAAARLDHPGIVKVHELGEDQGRRFIAMDLVEGESLWERLGRQGPLEPRAAAALVRGAADALAHAHEHGVLHRDLKPHNLLVLPSGEPVVTDFGLARAVDRESLTRTGESLGTPAFMPPEQVDDLKRVDARADVYGLGATLYAALTGRAPFEGDTALKVVTDVLRRPPTPPGALRPGLDRDLERLVLACLEKAPADRYPSMSALAQDLDRWLAGRPLHLRRPPLLRRLGRAVPPRRRALLAVVGLGLAGGAFLATRSPPDDCDPAGPDAATVTERSAVDAARRRIEEGQVPEALARLDEALRKDGEDVAARVLRASVLAARPRPERALEDLDVALRVAPDHLEALRLRGNLRRRLGDGQGAVSDLQRARRVGGAALDADLVKAHVALAVRREHEDDLAGVAAACSAALALDARSAPALAMAAGARWRLRLDREARWWSSDYRATDEQLAALLRDLDAARALDPGTARVDLERARALLDTDRWDEAMAAADAALDRARSAARDAADPERLVDTPLPIALLVRGVVRADAALALYNTAARLGATDGDRVRLRGELAHALDEMKDTFELRPAFRGGGQVLAVIIRRWYELPAALEGAAELDPRAPERRVLSYLDAAGQDLPRELLAHRALGRARHGVPDEALDDLARFLWGRRVPPREVAATWTSLAKLLAARAPAAAREALRRALAADGRYAPARALEGSLPR